MGAIIDYAIVIASRYQELKIQNAPPRDAIVRDAELRLPDDHHLRLDPLDLRLF